MIIETIYFVGVGIGVLINCINFAHAVNTMKSMSSFAFFLLEALKEIACLVVWPITLLLFLCQLPFQKGVADDATELMNNYNGYEDDENND